MLLLFNTSFDLVEHINNSCFFDVVYHNYMWVSEQLIH